MSLSEDNERLSLTVRADDVYRQYAQDQDSRKLFDQATQWLSAINEGGQDTSRQNIIDKEVHEAIIRAIFGSNMIERAGLNLDITIQLCRKILDGESLEIGDRDGACDDAVVELYRRQHPDLRDKSAQYIIRGRNEIVQHARAYQHMIHAFVVEKRDLSEDLIKETHRILATGVPIVSRDHPDVPPEMYGGIYRSVIVGAGSTNFTVPKFIPLKMRQMCESLKQDLAAAEEKKSIDPFSIASKYSLQFVEIHPFQDGNGRMCRIILNAILCRFAGVIVPIGEREEERCEYLDIKKRASRDMEGHGEYATFVLRRVATRLRQMKKKLTGKSNA
ncbi:hypothetical protein CP532_3543 [Ophiocordyceps camponoti-leonardi (nom. inval.)]|nr:hypothetical protein CP532_3543 [Ophiocordyceps camponoti-leonardi (nom. inval.)]